MGLDAFVVFDWWLPFDEVVLFDLDRCVAEDPELVYFGVVLEGNPVTKMDCYDEGLLVYTSVLVVAVYQALRVRHSAFVCLFFEFEDSGVPSPDLGFFDSEVLVLSSFLCGSRGERRKLSLMSLPRFWGNKELGWYADDLCTIDVSLD